jgi:hypothetical protein
MKTVISITEARNKLPSIIKSLKKSPDTVYQVTVHNEIVAEIKTSPVIKPGEAATRLLEARKRIGKKTGLKKYPISENIKAHLYAAEDRS